MKKLYRSLIALLFLGLYLPAFAAPNVEGDYEIYREDNPGKGVVAKMNFFNQKGSDFLVAGSGWGGTGRLDGAGGYYEWSFTDGRKGRTGFTIRNDGSLRGHVVGANNNINWIFIAKRVSQPARPAPSPCSACYSEQAVRTKGCEEMQDLLARNDCINKANGLLSKCLENCTP